MLVATRHRQTREVRGPDPNSVALIARPPGRLAPDSLLMDRRAKEDQLMAAAELAKLAKIQDLRNDWEKCSDRKVQANAVRRRVQSLLADNEVALEARRARLRELLESEKQEFAMESCSSQETVLEKQSRLRERAKQLKEKREMERLMFVEEKLEQQFREGCEELRTLVSRRNHEEIIAEREDQLRIKQELEQERKVDEEFFTKQWYADIAAKAEREEKETRKQLEANRSTVTFLQQQILELEQKKQQEKQLIEEQAQLLQEEEELRKLEDEKAAEEKRLSQLAMKNMLDQTLASKRAIEAKMAQEELAFDRKMLEQLLEQSRNEATQQNQRKLELREEDRRYREYLRQMKEEEKRRELELERICDAEVEKMWERRVKQWKLEKMARQKLLQQVLESRRQQLQEKFELNLSRREETTREREHLLAAIEENKQLEASRSVHHKQNVANYRSHLLGQIAYNQRQHSEALNEDHRIALCQREAEAEYQRKIEYLRDKPVLAKLHPLHRRLYQSATPGSRRGVNLTEM